VEPQSDDVPPPAPDFDPSAWRFLLADRSDFLFIEADATDMKLSEDLVSCVESLAQMVDARAVILIDEAHRIDACVRAEVFPSRPERLHLEIGVPTLALTPQLLKEFPAWHRTTSPYQGFSTVHFEKPLTNGTTTTTISRILKFLTSLTPSQSVAQLHLELDPAGLRKPTPSFTASSPSRPGDAGRGDSKDAIEQLIGIRRRLRESITMLDASSWGQLRGTPGSNPAASLSKYKTNGRLFSVSEGRRDLYPQFQFDDNAAPLPVIAEILKIAPADARGWPLLSWFDAGNVLLGGRRPRELLRQNPKEVKLAAVDYYSLDE
jgi:hypothetical protein